MFDLLETGLRYIPVLERFYILFFRPNFAILFDYARASRNKEWVFIKSEIKNVVMMAGLISIIVQLPPKYSEYFMSEVIDPVRGFGSAVASTWGGTTLDDRLSFLLWLGLQEVITVFVVMWILSYVTASRIFHYLMGCGYHNFRASRALWDYLYNAPVYDICLSYYRHS